jgi:hypothetical protein
MLHTPDDGNILVVKHEQVAMWELGQCQVVVVAVVEEVTGQVWSVCQQLGDVDWGPSNKVLPSLHASDPHDTFS